MSNARNLADVISGNYDVPAGSLDNVDLSSRVAKTGDTMTGALSVTNSNTTTPTGYFQNTSGSGDSPALIVRGGANNTNTVGTFEVQSYGGNKHLKVDGNGRVTMPYQTFFRAWSNVSYSQVDSAGVKQFGNAVQTGSAYNTSNGRFTAPVTGVYLFVVHMDFTNSSWSTMYLRKNGSGSGLNDDLIEKPGGGVFRNMTYMMNLAANDYVEVYIDGQSYNDYIAFQGFLLG